MKIGKAAYVADDKGERPKSPAPFFADFSIAVASQVVPAATRYLQGDLNAFVLNVRIETVEAC